MLGSVPGATLNAPVSNPLRSTSPRAPALEDASPFGGLNTPPVNPTEGRGRRVLRAAVRSECSTPSHPASAAPISRCPLPLEGLRGRGLVSPDREASSRAGARGDVERRVCPALGGGVGTRASPNPGHSDLRGSASGPKRFKVETKVSSEVKLELGEILVISRNPADQYPVPLGPPTVLNPPN